MLGWPSFARISICSMLVVAVDCIVLVFLDSVWVGSGKGGILRLR